MMVSTKGRYALRVMIDLAENEQNVNIPLKDIADRQGISLKYLESIMTVLSKAGCVYGHHGKGGGYQLVKPPEEYSIGEILRLTEGTLAPVACLESGKVGCERAADCRTLPVWLGLDKVINEYLDNVKLSNLLNK